MTIHYALTPHAVEVDAPTYCEQMIEVLRRSFDGAETDEMRCDGEAEWCCEKCGLWTCQTCRVDKHQCVNCFDDGIAATELLRMEARSC